MRSFYTHVPPFDNDLVFIACSDDDVAAIEAAQLGRYVGRLRGENFFYDAEALGGNCSRCRYICAESFRNAATGMTGGKGFYVFIM